MKVPILEWHPGEKQLGEVAEVSRKSEIRCVWGRVEGGIVRSYSPGGVSM